MPASLANRSHPVVSSSPSVDRFPIFVAAVGADEAIVSFDKKKLPSTDDARLDCGDVEPNRLGEPHHERLIFRRAFAPPDRGLEDMRGGLPRRR